MTTAGSYGFWAKCEDLVQSNSPTSPFMFGKLPEVLWAKSLNQTTHDRRVTASGSVDVRLLKKIQTITYRIITTCYETHTEMSMYTCRKLDKV